MKTLFTTFKFLTLIFLVSCSGGGSSSDSRVGQSAQPGGSTSLPKIESCDGQFKNKKVCGRFFGFGGYSQHVAQFNSDCTYQLSRVYDDGETINNSGVWYEAQENGLPHLVYFDSKLGSMKQQYAVQSDNSFIFSVNSSAPKVLFSVSEAYRICQ